MHTLEIQGPYSNPAQRDGPHWDELTSANPAAGAEATVVGDGRVMCPFSTSWWPGSGCDKEPRKWAGGRAAGCVCAGGWGAHMHTCTCAHTHARTHTHVCAHSHALSFALSQSHLPCPCHSPALHCYLFCLITRFPHLLAEPAGMTPSTPQDNRNLSREIQTEKSADRARNMAREEWGMAQIWRPG